MKAHLILTIVILAAIALPATPASEGASEKNIHAPIFQMGALPSRPSGKPRLATTEEMAGFWRSVVIFLRKDFIVGHKMVLIIGAGQARFGGQGITCFIAFDEGSGHMVGMMAYTGVGCDVTLETTEASVRVVGASGDVLFSIEKTLHQPPLPTPASVTVAAGARVAPADLVAGL